MLSYETYEKLAKTIQGCWNYETCDAESCGWYDWDDGFRCERYKSFMLTDQFFEDALAALKEKCERVEKFEEGTDDR